VTSRRSAQPKADWLRCAGCGNEIPYTTLLTQVTDRAMEQTRAVLDAAQRAEEKCGG
jgi:hypothetical protein